VIEIKTTTEQGFKITAKQIEAAITPKTKMFLFSSPCNPSGAVYSKEELEALAEVFKKHPGIFILSDEIYEYINYVGHPATAEAAAGKHQSMAQFAEIKDRVIVVNGLSKGFAMTGWRLGYIAAHEEIAKACEKVQGQFTALTNDLRPSMEMVKEFTRRKEKVLQLLKEIPGMHCSEPDGAFYVFPDVSFYFGKSDGVTTINNASDFSMYLLNNAHVTSVMGDAFGEPTCVRFSFANSMEKIEEGWRRIKESLAKLK
jgi:aspartate aminotransferase